MSDRLLDLEKKALHGHDMPLGLTQSEQLFYLSMTQLYALFNNRTYDRESAKRIKQVILSTYKKNAFNEHLRQYHAEINNRYSDLLTQAEKHGCPICKKLVRIFDGREKP